MASIRLLAILSQSQGCSDIPAHLAAADGKHVGEVCFSSESNMMPPPLVKYILPSEKLSVQVHPNYARRQVDGKSQCWLIEESAAITTETGMGTLLARLP